MTHTDNWTGCYDNGWKGIITDEAFSHPAKFSHGLIRRIYQHLLDEGMGKPGDMILDPFGGVGLGALYAMQNGLNWVGCELESRFVELGRANIELWNTRYAAHFPHWGTARLLQGDSRRLAEIVAGAGCVVGSPPFSGIVATQDPNFLTPGEQGKRVPSKSNQADYGQTPGQLVALPPGSIEAVIASPPFAGNTGGRGEASRNGIDAALFDRHSGGMKKGMGSDSANLDHLPQGNVGAVIASPPFAGSVGSDDPAKRGGLLVSDPKRAGDVNLTGSYGTTPGQLGKTPQGDFVAVVGSPPYEGTTIKNDANYAPGDIEQAKANGTTAARATWGYNKGSAGQDGYGSTVGQIGETSGETFWSAARLIVEQCALLLPSGAPAVWVVKNYIKGGCEVDFSGQWRTLCEACGFETVHVHRAWLVKRNGTQAAMANGHDTGASTTNLLGEEITKEGAALADKSLDVERYSFFRRLHIKKNPHLAIEWETVLCTRKKC